MSINRETVSRSIEWSRDHANKQIMLLADAQSLCAASGLSPEFASRVGAALLVAMDLEQRLAAIRKEIAQ